MLGHLKQLMKVSVVALTLARQRHSVDGDRTPSKD
jgi:hypothetical protein